MTTFNTTSGRPIEVQVRDLIDNTIARFSRSNVSDGEEQTTTVSEQSAESYDTDSR